MGGITPDDTPGPSVEEETQYDDRGPGGDNDGNPTVTGAVRRVGDDLLFKTSGGVVSLLTGTGLGAASHRTLDQLVHGIAEDSFEEYTYVSSKVTKLTIWTDNGKTIRIRESDFTYSGSQIATAVTRQYDAAGVLIVGETMTETFTFTGSSVTSIERVMS
jgi:hypothetical protein